MDAISEKGEYLWDMNPNLKNKKKIESALKNLHWIELIQRKSTYINIFIATERGAIALDWNKTADAINS